MDYPHFFNYIDLLVTSVLVIVSVCLTIASHPGFDKKEVRIRQMVPAKTEPKASYGWGMLISGLLLLCSSLHIFRYSENLAQLQEYVGNGIRAEGIVSPAHDRQTYFTICYRELQNRPYHLLYKQHSELDTTKPVCASITKRTIRRMPRSLHTTSPISNASLASFRAAVGRCWYLLRASSCG